MPGRNKANGTERTDTLNEEYKLIRAEILQYTEEYQSVRNMMYAATGAILGLNSSVWENPYLFLLPLVVILPSYILLYNYWEAVGKASTYIRIFLEKEPVSEEAPDKLGVRSDYCWEGRHYRFSKRFCSKRMKIPACLHGMHIQQLPYILCAVLCVFLYGKNVIQIGAISNHGERWPVIRLADDMGVISVLILIAIMIATIWVFVAFWKIDDPMIEQTWREIKAAEDKAVADSLRESFGENLRQ